jgi:hypothetical protein
VACTAGGLGCARRCARGLRRAQQLAGAVPNRYPAGWIHRKHRLLELALAADLKLHHQTRAGLRRHPCSAASSAGAAGTAVRSISPRKAKVTRSAVSIFHLLAQNSNDFCPPMIYSTYVYSNASTSSSSDRSAQRRRCCWPAACCSSCCLPLWPALCSAPPLLLRPVAAAVCRRSTAAPQRGLWYLEPPAHRPGSPCLRCYRRRRAELRRSSRRHRR